MKSLFFLVIIFYGSLVQAQDVFTVGRPSPDFVLNAVEHYTSTSLNKNDFKGKWLIIDCWNRFCSGCVAAFPRTDSLQRAFADRGVQVVLVGYNGNTRYTQWDTDANGKIHAIYEKVRKAEGLSLPVAYDSAFFDRFDLESCPYIVIIDPDGIVQGITCDLHQKHLEEILNGKHPDLLPAYNHKQLHDLLRKEKSIHRQDIHE